MHTKFKSAAHELLTYLVCSVNIIFPKGKKDKLMFSHTVLRYD